MIGLQSVQNKPIMRERYLQSIMIGTFEKCFLRDQSKSCIDRYWRHKRTNKLIGNKNTVWRHRKNIWDWMATISRTCKWSVQLSVNSNQMVTRVSGSFSCISHWHNHRVTSQWSFELVNYQPINHHQIGSRLLLDTVPCANDKWYFSEKFSLHFIIKSDRGEQLVFFHWNDIKSWNKCQVDIRHHANRFHIKKKHIKYTH